jgi:pimeloyl-ACP methyl ester carboxylesterase
MTMKSVYSEQPCARFITIPRSVALAAAILATVVVYAGGAGHAFVDRSQFAQLSPKVKCESLAGLKIPDTAIGLPTSGATISSATVVSATGETATATNVRHATPEYCQILGDILPVDSAAFNIKFQLNSPTNWNQKSIQVGGGGLNGNVPASVVLPSSGSPIAGAFPPDAPYPISRGYASFGGDSGHQHPGTTATWSLNGEAWTNFGHAGLKKTHDAAFAVIQALYGAKPKVSYFMGTSQGGREALEVAQRYPNDYDGVVATAPLIGYTAHVIHKTLLATVQTGSGWVPSIKLNVIGAEVMRQCDALDGIADGVISNYRACAALFDLQKVAQPYQRVRCLGGADTEASCLSDAQIATINQMHSPIGFGFDLANGLSSFPGYGTGRETLPGFLNINPQPNLSSQPALGQPGATLMYGILKDPSFNLLNCSIAPFQDKIQAASNLIDSTNPDLSRFFARGGRMIVKNSGSDYNSNPQIMMRYYDTVTDKFGQATVDAHLRYYVMPNTGHGGEGVISTTTGEAIPQYVDLIQMATDWVEKNVTPPDAPVASAMSKLPPYTVNATKPMCRYPKYPRYKGSGNPKQAASFVCDI